MRHIRTAMGIVLALASVLAISACGSSSSSSSTAASASSSTSSTASGTTSGAAGGTINVVAGTAPDSLDPGFGYTTQAAEADWLAYTGLTTYAHANGQPAVRSSLAWRRRCRPSATAARLTR